MEMLLFCSKSSRNQRDNVENLHEKTTPAISYLSVSSSTTIRHTVKSGFMVSNISIVFIAHLL